MLRSTGRHHCCCRRNSHRNRSGWRWTSSASSTPGDDQQLNANQSAGVRGAHGCLVFLFLAGLVLLISNTVRCLCQLHAAPRPVHESPPAPNPPGKRSDGYVYPEGCVLDSRCESIALRKMRKDSEAGCPTPRASPANTNSTSPTNISWASSSQSVAGTSALRAFVCDSACCVTLPRTHSVSAESPGAPHSSAQWWSQRPHRRHPR